LVGAYAQAYYLGADRKPTLTATVAAWAEYLPARFPLPHPSPRNGAWVKRNRWFEADVIPALREWVAAVLAS
jgi:uracil-DNA glycosylase